MENYNYGVHYDAGLGGLATASQTKKGYDSGLQNSYALEVHFDVSESTTSGALYFLQKFPSNALTAVFANIGQNILFSGGDEFAFPFPVGDFIRFRLERNGVADTLEGWLDRGDGVLEPIDFNGYVGGFKNEFSYFAGFGTDCKIALILMQRDTGNGWEDLARVDPNLVPHAANPGKYVQRGSVNADTNSTNRIYDTTDGNYFTIENNDVAGTFPAVYNIVSVNSEIASPVVELGAPITVEMSNPITPDAITLSDGINTYDFIFTTDGKVSTLEFPLTSDDTVPNLGDNLTLSVIKGPDTFTKTVSLQAPAGHTVRKLANPVELNESSYSHEMGFMPIAGDHYFWLTNTDFDINQRNICGPSGTPPWQYAIWHLSGAGLRKTNVVDGYGAINANPFMDAGPDQLNVAAGSTVILDASASYDTDGNIVSYEWLQTAGDDVVIDDAAASVTEFVAPSASYNQTLSFKVTGTDEEGATGEATVNIGVLAVPIIPTISVAVVPASILLNETIPAEATVTDAVSVEWTANLAGAFADSTEAITSFDAIEAGSLTLTCTATSSTGHTASASQTLTVVDPNDIPAPSVTITPIASAMSGRSFKPEIAVVDNFGEGVTYAWSATSGITVDDAALERPAFTVPIVDVDTPAQISCTVTDANGKATTATIDVLLIPYVITIDDIDTLHFELVSDNNIQAIKGMLNREIFSIKITDDPSKIPPGLVDDDSLLYLDHEIFSHIEIWTGAGDNFKSISSITGDPVGIRLKDRVEAHALMGKLTPELTLNGDRSAFDLTFVAFLDGYAEGLVLTASEQKPTTTGNVFKVFKPAPAA